MWGMQSLLDYYKENDIDVFEGCTVPAPINLDLLKSYIVRRCGLLQPIYGEPYLFKMQVKMWFDSNQWRMDHLVKMLLAEYEPAENVFEYEHWKEEHSGTDKNGGKDSLKHGETHTLSGSDTLGHGETHTLSGKDSIGYGETHTLSGSDTLGHGETHTLSGNDTLGHGETHTLSGTDTDTDTTSNTHTVSAYNSSGYQADSKDEKGGSISTTYGKTDTASGTDTTTYGKVDTASGTDTTTYGKVDTASGTDTTTYGKIDTASGTDETTYGKVDTASGTDTTTYGKVDTASGTDTTTYGKTDTASGTDETTYGKTFEHGEIIEYTKDRHGNVGVKSSSDLMQEELNLLERFNVYETLASWFEKDNMIQVY